MIVRRAWPAEELSGAMLHLLDVSCIIMMTKGATVNRKTAPHMLRASLGPMWGFEGILGERNLKAGRGIAGDGTASLR